MSDPKFMPVADVKVAMIWHLSHGDMVIEEIIPDRMHGAAVRLKGKTTNLARGDITTETSLPLPLATYRDYFSQPTSTTA